MSVRITNIFVKKKLLVVNILCSSLIAVSFSGLVWAGTAGGSIAVVGKITSSTGSPVSNISVYATDPGSATVDFGPVTSASDGMYELDVDTGTYDIHFDPPSGSGLQSFTDDNIVVTTGATLDVQLTPTTHTFSTTLTNQDNQPLNAQVYLYNSSSGSSPDVQTDSNGHASVSRTAGTYGVYVQAYGNGVDANNADGSINASFSSDALASADLTNSDASQDFSLGFTRLTLTVKDGSGNPAANAGIVGNNGYDNAMPVTSNGTSYTVRDGSVLFGYNMMKTDANGSVTVIVPDGSTFPANSVCVTFTDSSRVCNASDITASGTTANVLFQEAPNIPVAPTNLTATSPTNSDPELSWAGSYDATSYNVYRNGSLIGTTTTTTYTDHSLTSDGSYTYSVTAIGGTSGLESGSSNTVTVVYDTTKPSITYTVSPVPNASGWNSGSVEVMFNCSDALSGVASCTSPAIFMNEGVDQTVTGTAVDNAGNSMSVTTGPVNIDGTAPTMSAASWDDNSITPAGTATLTVTATDSLSGVAGGEYYIDNTDPGNGNGTTMTYADGKLTSSFSGLAAGTYTINYRAEDVAGNWDLAEATTLVVAPAPPSDLTAQSPTNSAPVLNWAAVDGAESYNIYRDGVLIASTSQDHYTDSSLSSDGSYSYYVTAKAGEVESANSNTVSVVYDTTAPNISYMLSPNSPNGTNNWYTSNVTVTYTCSDTGSGVASCTSPTTLNTDGTNQVVTGVATDNAGNSKSVATSAVKIDKTAPSVSAAALSSITILYGSHVSDSISANVSDATSGVAGGEYYVDTDPGSGQGTALTLSGGQLTGSADFSSLSVGQHTLYIRSLDNAGNWSTSSAVQFTVASPLPDAPTNLSAVASPTNQSPALTWTASAGANSYNIYRNGTKVGTSTTPSYTDSALSSDGTYSYYVTAVNQSGESSHSNTVSVVYDKTPPTITYTLSSQPNSYGWYNSSVTVTFHCGDSLSGVASCPSPVTVSAQGENQMVNGTATDNAGNSASVTVSGINIDKTPPTTQAPSLSTTLVLISGQNVTVTSNVSDGLSGVVGGEYYITTSNTAPTNTPGTGTHMTYNGTNHTITATFAATGNLLTTYYVWVRSQDAAGNWSSFVSGSYTVVVGL
ncbi:MAG TPA: hypothetical protein VG992_01670 [Candidatus Saccharimonadales bacterium]|nr:hypothetical protein [Candidatus Saccharimonadales bacterium]